MSDESMSFELPEALSKADNLPSIPAIAVEVLNLCRDENACGEDFSELISKDPALSAKLLKLANSSMFCMGREIGTLDQATMVLGIKTVQLMSLSFSLVVSLPSQGSSGGFDFSMYWRRSLMMAVAGRAFAQVLARHGTDEAFMCGLMSQIGQLVMVQCMKGEYAKVLNLAGGAWPEPQHEREVLGYDHLMVGSALLKSWDLPESIYIPIGYFRSPETMPESVSAPVRLLTEILNMAHESVDFFYGRDKGTALQSLERLAEAKGISKEQLEEFLAGLEGGVSEMADMLNIQLPSGHSYQTVLEEARQQMTHLGENQGQGQVVEERRMRVVKNDNRERASMAGKDGLTQLCDRAGFDVVFEKEISSRLASQEVLESLGLLLLQLDQLEAIRRNYGGKAAEEVLKVVAQTLSSVTRKEEDLPARFDEKHFAILMPQISPDGMMAMAERLRGTIENLKPSFCGKIQQITVSIGGACIHAVEDVAVSKEELLRAAEMELRQCLENGNNCCEILPSPIG